MPTPNDPNAKAIKTLDKDLSRISMLEQATMFTSRPLVAPGIALAFIVIAGLAAGFHHRPPLPLSVSSGLAENGELAPSSRIRPAPPCS